MKGRYDLQCPIPIGSRLTISHSASQSISLKAARDQGVALCYSDDEADDSERELVLACEGRADAGSPAVSHWVVTKEVEKMRAYRSAGPKKPGCWQVSDDGFQYDARDQAVIECWWGNHASRRQAVKHVTRLMGDVLASAESGTDASQPMVRLLTVLRHMSGYFPRDFLFVPFLSTVRHSWRHLFLPMRCKRWHRFCVGLSCRAQQLWRLLVGMSLRMHRTMGMTGMTVGVSTVTMKSRVEVTTVIISLPVKKVMLVLVRRVTTLIAAEFQLLTHSIATCIPQKHLFELTMAHRICLAGLGLTFNMAACMQQSGLPRQMLHSTALANQQLDVTVAVYTT
jgi:hypothetical protein